MELSEQEVDLKAALIVAMHNAERTTYKRGGISVDLTVEKEKIKVRVVEDEQPSKAKKAKTGKQTSFDPAEIEKQESEKESPAVQ